MRKISIITAISIFSMAYSQVGINTTNPQAVFHVDGAKDNPVIGVPSATQQSNDLSYTQTGNLGIGTISPNAKLEIKGKVSVSPDQTGNASSIDHYESEANGSNKVSLKAPDNLPADRNITLPANAPQAGYVLITDGSGITSWGAVNPSQSTLASVALINSTGVALPINKGDGEVVNVRNFQVFDNVVTDPNNVFVYDAAKKTYTYVAPQSGNYLISAYIVPNSNPQRNTQGFYYPVNLEVKKNMDLSDLNSGSIIMDSSTLRYATPGVGTLLFSVSVAGMVKLNSGDRLNLTVLLPGTNATAAAVNGISHPLNLSFAGASTFKAYFSVTAL